MLILFIFLDLLVEFTQYLFCTFAHDEVIIWYLFLLGGLHRGSHDGLVHCGAVAHGTVDHAPILLSCVFLTVWKPALELVLTSASQLIFDHNIIYIIYLTKDYVYYNIKLCKTTQADTLNHPRRKLHKARATAGSRNPL